MESQDRSRSKFRFSDKAINVVATSRGTASYVSLSEPPFSKSKKPALEIN